MAAALYCGSVSSCAQIAAQRKCISRVCRRQAISTRSRLPIRCAAASPFPLQDAPDPSCEQREINLSSLLQEVRAVSQDFIFVDDDYEEPIWELEHRFLGKPRAVKDVLQSISEVPVPELQPLQPLPFDVPSAYSAEQGFKELMPHDLYFSIESNQVALLLDVRTAAEFAAGHLEGSQNIPMDDLSAAVRAGKLDQHRQSPIVVVCGSGMRSAQACVRLSKVFGFGDLTNLQGGITAWRSQGLPVVGDNLAASKQGCGGGCGCH